MFAPSNVHLDADYKRLARQHIPQQNSVWLADQIATADRQLARHDLPELSRKLLHEVRCMLVRDMEQVRAREISGLLCACCDDFE